MLRKTGFVLLLAMLSFAGIAQETLPKFTLLNKGNNRIVISWTNPYGIAIKQLSIQRSLQSSWNFKTIQTLPDPTVEQNGYVDTKSINDHMYYRLYILLDSGKYVFSKAKQPNPDTIKTTGISKEVKPREINKNEIPSTTNKPELNAENRDFPKLKDAPERIFYIKKRDSIIGQIEEKSFKRYRDSVTFRTKDTISFATRDTLLIKPFIPIEIWRISKYVFTEKDGNVKIALPEAALRKYTIKFFELDNSPLFEVKLIKDNILILDRANFMHSGWFKFELYEDGKLKEKQKLFVPKDF